MRTADWRDRQVEPICEESGNLRNHGPVQVPQHVNFPSIWTPECRNASSRSGATHLEHGTVFIVESPLVDSPSPRTLLYLTGQVSHCPVWVYFRRHSLLRSIIPPRCGHRLKFPVPSRRTESVKEDLRSVSSPGICPHTPPKLDYTLDPMLVSAITALSEAAQRGEAG